MANLTYDDYAAKTRSSKIVLCHVEPSQRLTLFSLDSGSIYKRKTEYFVVSVKENGIELLSDDNIAIVSGSWFYDSITSDLYIRTTDDSNPKTKTIVVTYRLFFANMPISLPYDLAEGVDVYYEGRLSSSSPINKDLDEEQIGVVLETSTSISLINSDGYFDGIYDKLIFENKNMKLFSWSEIIPLSEKKMLFDGTIQNKSFSESSVGFSAKDFTFKLREKLKLENFSTNDGNVPERYLNTPKRRLFGKFKQLACVPTDSILDGFNVTGVISATNGTNVFTGTGSSFLDELSPTDQISYFNGIETLRYSIKEVLSDTSLTITQVLEVNIDNASFTCKPQIPWRKKNRFWHIAGHKLRSPETVITFASSGNRITVADSSDMFAGDLIRIDGEETFIKRVNGNDMALTSVLQQGRPTGGEVVSKSPLSKAYLSGSEIFVDRDWTVSNTLTDASLTISELAEFNIAAEINLSFNMTFTNGSRVVTMTGIDFRNEASIRDWLRSDDITHSVWYEILDIQYDKDSNFSTVTLRTPYGGVTDTTGGLKKNVSVINDTAVITVDCMGLERDGVWVKTASDAVKDLLENDGSFTNLNTESFIESDNDAPFIMSLAVPSNIGGSNAQIKEVISKINESVFGSLVTDADFNLRYQVLTPEKPTDIKYLEDHDIIGISGISSRNEIVREVNAKYGFFSDRFTGTEAFNLYAFENEFVDDLVESKASLDIELNLFDRDDAITIAQRYALYNSLSQTSISISGKLNLALLALNDKVYLNIARLFKRFGNNDTRKIGIINKVSNNGSDVTLTINDLGNAFNRVSNISSTTASEFTNATDDEKIKYSYVVDDDILTPDITSDVELYSNLIG